MLTRLFSSIFRACFLGLFALGLGTISWGQRLQMYANPIWVGINGSPAAQHLWVTFENRGGPIIGQIEQTGYGSDRQSVNYEIELPEGSQKRIYYRLEENYSSELVFRYGSRFAKCRVESAFYDFDQIRSYGLISDNQNDLSFLTKSNGQTVRSGSCKPEDAPERIAAYTDLDCVILGEGTERLTEQQCSAIYAYLLEGGTVVINGGTSNTARLLPFWKPYLPLKNFRNVNTQVGTELVGDLATGADETVLQMGKVFSAQVGTGKLVIYSADLSSEAFLKSNSRISLLNQMGKSDRSTQRNTLAAAIGSQSVNQTGVDPFALSAATPGGTDPYSSNPNDPFELKPPPTKTIFILLLIYFVVVIPINFLVLKKLNRMELAWITCPVLSLLFAGIVLFQTVSLYRASSSSLTEAVIMMDGRGGPGVSEVRSQIFFPRAGAYDLQLSDVDSIAGTYTQGRIMLDDFGNTLLAKQVPVANLSFKEVTIRQRTSALSGLKVMFDPRLNRLTVSNQTSFELKNVRFEDLRLVGKIESVPPGNTQSFDFKFAEKGKGEWSKRNGLLIRAQVQGLRLGSQFGALHPKSYTQVQINPIEVTSRS